MSFPSPRRTGTFLALRASSVLQHSSGSKLTGSHVGWCDFRHLTTNPTPQHGCDCGRVVETTHEPEPKGLESGGRGLPWFRKRPPKPLAGARRHVTPARTRGLSLLNVVGLSADDVLGRLRGCAATSGYLQKGATRLTRCGWKVTASASSMGRAAGAVFGTRKRGPTARRLCAYRWSLEGMVSQAA